METRVEARSRKKTGGTESRLFESIAAASAYTKVEESSVLACLRDSTLRSGKWRFTLRPASDGDVIQIVHLPLDPAQLEAFIAEQVYEAPGYLIPFADFYTKFQDWLPVEERSRWTKQKLSWALPAKFASGNGNENKTYIINAAFEPKESSERPYYVSGGRIKRS